MTMLFARSGRLLSTNGHAFLQCRKQSTYIKLTFGGANMTYYHNASVRQVNVPTLTGRFGILAYHVPTLAVINPGVVEVVEKSYNKVKFFVSSGTVTVNADLSVQVLAEEAHKLEDFNLSECSYILELYQQELATATTDLGIAEAYIAVECARELVKALT